jgi:hypothetical protein
MPVVPPRGEELYREEIPVTPMKILVGFEISLGVFFMIMALVQIISSPIVSNAPPTFFWGLMAAVFFSTTWLISSFVSYRLTIEPTSLNLSFGRFKTDVLYENIETFEQDTRSGLVYGGWGMRTSWTRDGWVKAYTILGKSRIGLRLKSGRVRHIIFSTENPDTVMEILRGRLKNAPGHVRRPF